MAVVCTFYIESGVILCAYLASLLTVLGIVVYTMRVTKPEVEEDEEQIVDEQEPEEDEDDPPQSEEDETPPPQDEKTD